MPRHYKLSPKYYKRYVVYDNKTDFPVIIDGTARECAKAMHMSYESFFSAVCRCKKGQIKRWYIEEFKEEEE